MALKGRDNYTVAIIGGGFSGAAIAYHLDRLLDGRKAVSIVVVEPREEIGAGLAYGTEDPAHRINVPASRMSLDPEQPLQFEDWLLRSHELKDDHEATRPDRRIFPRRSVFGHYVRQALKPAIAAGRVIHKRGTVISGSRQGPGYRVALTNGTFLEADIAVIATTHPPPNVPTPFLGTLEGHPGFVADATRSDALCRIKTHDRILIVGSGLTMADVVASLHARGHRGQITAFSRRGQLSAPHPSIQGDAFGDFTRDPAISALGLLQKVRTMVIETEALRLPWQCVFDALRQQAGSIWQALPLLERKRFLRHLRAYWDARRYRIAPQVHQVLENWQADGQLNVYSARALRVEARDEAIRVELALKRKRIVQSITVDHVIIATGPAHKNIFSALPYLNSLQIAGLVTPDALGLGLATDKTGRAIDRNGQSQSRLFVGGPLARGTFGELMGLPEVANYAKQIAASIFQNIEEDQVANTGDHVLTA